MDNIIKTIQNDYVINEYKKTNIYIIENIIPEEDCENFIKFIEHINTKKLSYYNGNNVECFFETMTNLLKMNDEEYYYFSTELNEYNKLMNKIKNKDKISTNKLNGLFNQDIIKMNSKMKTYFNIAKDLMKPINDKIIFDQHTGFILRKIYGKTRLHKDGVTEIYDNTNVVFIRENKTEDYRMIRNSSIIFSLNDNYDGGEFNFPYYDLSIKLKKGSMIIFPPYWTHEHETNFLKNNTYRYTISTWSCEII